MMNECERALLADVAPSLETARPPPSPPPSSQAQPRVRHIANTSKNTGRRIASRIRALHCHIPACVHEGARVCLAVPAEAPPALLALARAADEEEGRPPLPPELTMSSPLGRHRATAASSSSWPNWHRCHAIPPTPGLLAIPIPCQLWIAKLPRRQALAPEGGEAKRNSGGGGEVTMCEGAETGRNKRNKRWA